MARSRKPPKGIKGYRALARQFLDDDRPRLCEDCKERQDLYREVEDRFSGEMVKFHERLEARIAEAFVREFAKLEKKARR